MPQASQKIIELASQLGVDEEKFDGGNASAGTRARKTLQEIRKLCAERRNEIQQEKNKEAQADAA